MMGAPETRRLALRINPERVAELYREHRPYMVRSLVRRVLSDVASVSPERPIPRYWPESRRTGAAVSTRLTRSGPTPRDPFTTVDDRRGTSGVEVAALIGYRSDDNQYR